MTTLEEYEAMIKEAFINTWAFYENMLRNPKQTDVAISKLMDEVVERNKYSTISDDDIRFVTLMTLRHLCYILQMKDMGITLKDFTVGFHGYVKQQQKSLEDKLKDIFR